MTDYPLYSCPVCGGRLCVDMQYPDRIHCDTCEYEVDIPPHHAWFYRYYVPIAHKYIQPQTEQKGTTV